MLIQGEDNSEIKAAKKLIFQIEKPIQEATSRLSQLDKILKNICQEIQEELRFDFASIQLIRPEESIIEAVSGTGIAAKWRGAAKHYLEPERELRDIQADIAQTCRTEIIAGWDKENRFDKWAYNKYSHNQSVRIFTPILLIQDDKGQNNEDWFEDFEWKFATNQSGQDINELNEEWFSCPERRQAYENGQHVAIELLLPRFYSEDGEFIVTVIGTIEVGYEKAHEHEPIPIEQAIEFIRLVGKKALDLRKFQLPCVLEIITKNAMEIVGADGATLHFLRSDNQNFYIHKLEPNGSIKQSSLSINDNYIFYAYEVFLGLVSRVFLRAYSPRKDGLGQRAIEARKKSIETKSTDNSRYSFISMNCQGDDCDALETLNPIAYRAGIRAMAAFPLIFDGHEGVLYISFRREHEFKEKELRLLEIFANRAEDAIRYAFTHERQRDRSEQLLVLHAVSQTLASMPDEEKLLNYIAWYTLNILAADTVTIYRYFEFEKIFSPLPVMAGRFKNIKKARQEVKEHQVPAKLVKHGKNLYLPDEEFNDFFRGSSFHKGEKIKATAAILLKVGKQIVGTMFINYRRLHEFSHEKKQIIETLASSAAIAIKDQRWLARISHKKIKK